MTQVRCPHCGNLLEDGEHLAGELVSCPVCSEQFYMPDANRPGAEAAPQGVPLGEPTFGSNSRMPGKLLAVQILVIVGAVSALFWAVGVTVGLFGLGLCWPGTWLAFVVGIAGLIHALKIGRQPLPRYVPVLQILLVFNLDPLNVVLGIVELILLNDDDIQTYYASRGISQ